jgi:MOSC domain-containing protein YiiM
MTGQLLSVSVVHQLIPDGPGDLDRTAIDKRPVPGRVRVRALGVVGDVSYDRTYHGGLDRAVYGYAREDLDWWAGELGRELVNGQFGENFTTAGIDVTNAVIGERWRVGEDGVEVEVAMPRIPCATFQGWLAEPHWVKRFFAHGAPGAYLRVTAEGTTEAGDEIEVVHRPAHGVTLGEVFVKRDVDADRLLRLCDEPGVAADLVEAVRRDLAARAR